MSSDATIPLFIHTHPIFPDEKIAIKITNTVMRKYELSIQQPLLIAYWLEKKHIRIESKHLYNIATLVEVTQVSKLGDFHKVEIMGKRRVLLDEVLGSTFAPYASYQSLYTHHEDVEQQEQIIKVKKELLLENIKKNKLTLTRLLKNSFEEQPESYELWVLKILKHIQLMPAEQMKVFQTVDLEFLFEKTQDLLSNFLIEHSLKTKFLEDSEEQFTYRRQKTLMLRRIQELKRSIQVLDKMHRSEKKTRAKLEQEEAETDHHTQNQAHRSKKEVLIPLELTSQEQERIDEILKQWDELSSDDYEDDDSWDQEDVRENVEDRIRALPLTAEAKAEVKRVLQQQNSGAMIGPELHNIKSFLEVVSELPWEKRAPLLPFNLKKLQTDLDQEHYGLKEVKSRMIEFLAASTLANEPMGQTLCLLGPPGVGKTSLVKVIAHSLGRPFVRISLGGVQDEADIRGHRRTYVSATPGRICNALKKAQVKNPVILLDEVDKMASGVRGDPAAALLEVLDPEQNHAFRDHYLEIPLDLSEVIFICTANDARGMSAPLRDRLEMIELSGYTHSEKVHIAKKHLINRQLSKHGLPKDALQMSAEALDQTILQYCKEAGVRQLERKLAQICRKMSVETLKKRHEDESLDKNFYSHWHVSNTDLMKYLGAPSYPQEQKIRHPQQGVSYGLAWTAVGGSVLKIETACWPGKGHVKMTGRMGDVMKESVDTALTALRIDHQDAIEAHLGKTLSEWDLHIHLPEGATPKDGPSAGITLYCALYSLLTGKILNHDIAMTGECTLQGQILGVGGLKEKLLAAQQEKMQAVILPQANQAIVMDYEDEIRGDLTLHWVQTAKEALQYIVSDSL